MAPSALSPARPLGLARCAALVLTALILTAAGALPLASVHAQESGSRPADEEPAAPKGPVFPQPTIDDPALAKSYSEGIAALEQREFDSAKKIFGSLRRSLAGEARDAAERCYEESRLGLEIEDISTKVGKRQHRKAIRDCEKALAKFEGLALVVEVEALLEECEEALYKVIADFEESDADSSEGAAEADDEGDEEEEPRGRNQNRGGRTGFGQNTSFEKADPTPPKSKRAALVTNVREGKRSLLWRTGRDLSTLNFENLELRLEDYRYLNISIRVEDPKQAPALRLFFDAEDGPLNAGGGQGRRGGRRGGAAVRVSQRMGFVSVVEPKGTWQDLRIDLKKFKAQANARWGDVRAFRVIHLPGADGRVFVDNIRLERE